MNKATITASAPILLVKDIIASTNYYCNKLGFNYKRIWGEPPSFCIVNRNGFQLMLSQVTDVKYIVPHYKAVENMWNVYFWVDDVENLYTEFTDSGASIDYELCNQPYGCREFGIQDLDGYDIAFGQILEDN